MFSDSQTTLYIVLSISVALLTIFLCVTLIYLIFILRDASKVIERVRETVDRVNTFIMKPVSLAASIVDQIRPLIEGVLTRAVHSTEREKRKK